ncbi:MAG: DNA recombination protein RmuC [Candidatus Omnitrophica bacterium]|nr:DNA recombination protein RmuC [Candidatus Omnitrophota bacterium]
MSELNKNINQNLQMLTQQLLSSQQSVGERLDAATRVVGQVQKDLGFLSLATERVFEVGKNIAGLEEILSAPKLRGGLGEFFLQDLLQQVLPSSHVNFQYKFKNGDVVDAVILMGKGKVCIDSKFPLDNFRRIIDSGNDEEKRKARKNFYSDVKKHIDVIAAKYILPDEGTFDFALMYIPAENVYYELIIREDSDNGQSLSSYGLSKKVIPVSPNSLYIFLQAIVCGLNGMRVEQHVQQIIQHLARLRGDIDRFKQDFDVLGRHIMNMKNKYDEADKKITDFEGKLTAVCQFEKNE